MGTFLFLMLKRILACVAAAHSDACTSLSVRMENRCNPYEVYEMLFLEELVDKELSYPYLRSACNSKCHLDTRKLERFNLVVDCMFPKDNPILPLLILGENFKYLARQICGKFDLNVTYRISTNILKDEHNSGIQYSSDTINWQELVIDPNDIGNYSVCEKVKHLNKITISFLEILDFLNDTELSESYGYASFHKSFLCLLI